MSEATNISVVVDSGLCVSCGMCESICPMESITFAEISGMWLPKVADCCGCGKCLKVCPGKGFNWDSDSDDIMSCIEGDCIKAFSAWSTDKDYFANSVSGGVTTQIVHDALESGHYSVAFLTGPANVGVEIKSTPYRDGDSLISTQKSKYLQVNHSNVIKYLKDNPDERVVVVAVPCATRGLLNAMSLLKIDRSKVLFLGLFCDKTMISSVLNRLSSLVDCPVSSIDFRDKWPCGWPGDVTLHLKNGEAVSLPRERRMEVKEYFCPERCLYCMDKLNVLADISLGDNYTNDGANAAGANSVIIRTKIGERAWNFSCSNVKAVESSLASISSSQRLKERLQNLEYSAFKEGEVGFKLNSGLPSFEGGFHGSAQRSYELKLSKIDQGKRYRECPEELERSVKRSRPSAVRKGLSKIKDVVATFSFLKR